RSENGALRKKYCSRECAFHRGGFERRMREQQRRFKSMLKRSRVSTCDVCSGEFNGRAGQKRCSKQCSMEAARRQASRQTRQRGCIACGAAPCVMVDKAHSQYCA